MATPTAPAKTPAGATPKVDSKDAPKADPMVDAKQLSPEQLEAIRAQVRADIEQELAEKALKDAEDLAARKAKSLEAAEISAADAHAALTPATSAVPAGCLRAMVRKSFHVDRDDIVGLINRDGASVEVYEGELVVMKADKIRMLEGQGKVRAIG